MDYIFFTIIMATCSCVVILIPELNGNPMIWFIDLVIRPDLLEVTVSFYWISLIVIGTLIADRSFNRFHWSLLSTRKVFHFLTVVMFSPILAIDRLRPFIIIAFAVALSVFIVVEFIRIHLVVAGELKVIETLNQFLTRFLLERERSHSSLYIMAHISLLFGVAVTVWISSSMLPPASSQSFFKAFIAPYLNSDAKRIYATRVMPVIVSYLGLITVGVGDAFAAICGSKFGRTTYGQGNRKTLCGTACGYIAMCMYAILVVMFNCGYDGLVDSFVPLFVVTLPATSLMEAFTEEMDNILLPLYSTAVFILSSTLLLMA
jgi:dolichol kinase